jgi:hypothetical protein
MKASAEELQKAGIEESFVVNFSIALMSESRIKNADLTAAINNSLPQENIIAVKNVISAATLTTNPAAKEVRLTEESIFQQFFTEAYFDVKKAASQMFSDFSQNSRFNEIMGKIKQNPNIMRTRLLDPKHPNGGRKNFYSKQVYSELGKYYTLKQQSKT